MRDSLTSFQRVFDKDMDDILSMKDLQHFLTTKGAKMSSKEMEDMIKIVDKENKGVIRCEGNVSISIFFKNIF